MNDSIQPLYAAAPSRRGQQGITRVLGTNPSVWKSQWWGMAEDAIGILSCAAAKRHGHELKQPGAKRSEVWMVQSYL